jgi:tetratricopeptide (TPR) repeat protein
VTILTDLLKQPVGDATEEARSDVWNNLATGYINMGEYAKAEPYVRMALAYSQKTRPAIHPDIAQELIDLSMIERELRNYPAAEQDLRKALAIDMAWYPKGHQETGDVKRLLANVLVLEHRYDDAMPLAREAMADEQKSLGTSNRRTAYAMQTVGLLDLKRGNLAEASSLFEQEIASLQALKDPTDLPKAFDYLGDVYIAQQQYKPGIKAYRKAVELYGSSLVPAGSYQAQCNRKLAEALMFEGQYAAAELPLLAGYRVWTSNPNVFSEELRLTRADLVKVYEALQRKPELARFQRELGAQPE